MGKGSRNRQYRYESFNDVVTKKGNKKKGGKTSLVKWPSWTKYAVLGAIALVLVTAIVLGLLASGGVFKRSNVIIKSPSGKFDITEPMARYMAFLQNYSSAYQYYSYYGSYLGLTSQYASAESYAFLVARYACAETPRDSVDEILGTLKSYVAGCEAAYNSADYETLYKLTEEDKKSAEAAYDALEDVFVQNNTDSTTYSYQNFKTFLKNAIGLGVDKNTVVKMSEITQLYNKYYSAQVIAHLGDVDDSEIAKYVLENAGNYYKVDYLTYNFKDAESDAIGTAFEGTTADDFRKYVFEKTVFDKAYAEAYPESTTHDADLDDAWNAYNKAVLNYKATELAETEAKTFLGANYDEATATVVDKYLNGLFKDKSNEESYGTVRFTEAGEGKTTYTLVRVEGALTEGEEGAETVTGYTYKQLTLENDVFLAFLDTLDAATAELKDLGITDGTGKPVQVAATDELEQWLGANTVTEETETVAYNRVFARADGEKKVTFTADGGCTLTLLVKAPYADLDEEEVAFAGYLKYTTEAEANAACDNLKNLNDQQLYYAFSNLKNGDTAATVSVTMKAGTDDNLDAFILGDEKTVKVLANKAGDAYYLAFTFGKEKAYARDIRMTLVSENVENAMSANDIEASEKALNKIGKPTADAQ